jgi:hypothetical protein
MIARQWLLGLGKERAMNIGRIIREIEVLPEEEQVQLPEDQPTTPEPTQPEPVRQPVPA